MPRSFSKAAPRRQQAGAGWKDKCSPKNNLSVTIPAQQIMGNPNASLFFRSLKTRESLPVANHGGRTVPYAACLLLLWSGACSTHPGQSSEFTPAAAPAAAGASSAPAAAPAPAAADPLVKAASAPSLPFEGEGWKALFDGRSLTGWRETQFAGHGESELRDGMIVLKMGDPFTGINWTNDFPAMNYEIALDAMRVTGSDFFCGLTVPVNDSFCSLIVGGWGGALVGISSLDGMDASENETTKYVTFQQGRWYRIRLRVTQDRIEGWIDQEKLIDVVTAGKRISLRPGEIEESKPFGLACWQTSAALRNIQLRRVSQPADPPKKY